MGLTADQVVGEIYLKSLHKIAEITGLDANAAATTAIPFVNDGSLATHAPVLTVVRWASGNLAAVVITVEDPGSNKLLTGEAMLGVASTQNFYKATVGTLFRTAGDISVTVDTPAGAAATIDVSVYGISLT